MDRYEMEDVQYILTSSGHWTQVVFNDDSHVYSDTPHCIFRLTGSPPVFEMVALKDHGPPACAAGGS